MASFLPRFTASALVLLGIIGGQQAAAQAPAKQWDKRYGGSAYDGLYALHQTTDGGYLLAGSSESPISGVKSQAKRGYWVVRTDANGNKLWDKTFGGTSVATLCSVRPTADGGYLLGGTSRAGLEEDKTQPNRGGDDYWVVKIDANGTKLWDKTFGGTDTDVLQDLQPTADGGAVLGGYSSSGVTGDKSQPNYGAGSDFWVIRLDANGNKLWDKTLGTTEPEPQKVALCLTPDGGILLGTSSAAGINGDKTQSRKGGSDYWLIRLDANGTKLWDRTIGGTGEDYLYALAPTNEGGFILGGHSSSRAGADKTQPSRGDADYWLVKVDALGQFQWDSSLGGPNSDFLFSVQQTTDGGYFAAGHSYSGQGGDKSQALRGINDYWVAKLNPEGAKQWEASYGGSDYDFLSQARQTADGGYLLGGQSHSSQGGDVTQATYGAADFWVVKIGGTATATTAPKTAGLLHAYPNPAGRQVRLPLPADAPRAGLRLRLLDAQGRTVATQPVTATAAAEVPVTLGQPAAGLYLLRLEGPNGYLATQPLLVE
ncbi:T9SS type A sorting domain-containing protein [Hymenobacter aquaticus]|uniref:T9SS type A sorting domain-containing protein n=1 Tax=Hymenobacter aquaticus TaxID=1867101 RepID=A0A4Z0Q6N6_9BACT|nr:T9SS type A sorting domain-containing protein [Hymenobacter aquaticus]TGE24803.1 T9SS type A sorting domain-containing protein [Hymenobacter aquaticus]